MAEPDDRAAGPIACASCGTSAPDAAAARVSWSLGIERDRPVWTCVYCSRQHLRSIEGKLDSEWW